LDFLTQFLDHAVKVNLRHELSYGFRAHARAEHVAPLLLPVAVFVFGQQVALAQIFQLFQRLGHLCAELGLL